MIETRRSASSSKRPLASPTPTSSKRSKIIADASTGPLLESDGSDSSALKTELDQLKSKIGFVLEASIEKKMDGGDGTVRIGALNLNEGFDQDVAVSSPLTRQKSTAAKQFIENHYKNYLQGLQERQERSRKEEKRELIGAKQVMATKASRPQARVEPTPTLNV